MRLLFAPRHWSFGAVFYAATARAADPPTVRAHELWYQHPEALAFAVTALFTLLGLLAVVVSLLLHIKRQAKKLARESAERAAILNALGEGVIVQNARDDTIAFINPAGAALLGYRPDELIGLPSHQTLHYALPNGDPYPIEACPIYQTVRDGRVRRVDDHLCHRSGEAIPVEMVVAPLRDERGRVVRVVTAFHDLRERNRLLARIEQIAHHDPLTGLFNRAGFERALKREAARLKRNRTAASVVLIDLDHFKTINDRYGHEMGDAVLRRLGQFLTERLRPTDLVARWGGEEIVVLLPETNLATAVAIVERLRQSWQKEVWSIAHHPSLTGITFSAGIAQWNGETPFEAVFRAADQALYRAKRSGRNRVEIAQLPTPPAQSPSPAPATHR